METTLSATRPSLTELASARTVQQVLNLVIDLEDPGSWLHRQFYGVSGVMPTTLEPVKYPLHGHTVLMKNETTHILQLDGRSYKAASFKRRGALLAGLLARRANPRLTHFVTASHGNHGIGVAMAARTLGVQAEIYCPETVNVAKLRSLRELGASVHTKGLKTFEEAVAAAEVAAERKSAALVHPFDQVEVIAGQATIGLEVVRDLLGMAARGEVDLHRTPIEVDVAVAGGGLLGGVAVVFRRYKDLGILGEDNVQLYGAQMVGCDAARRCVADVHGGGNGEAVFAAGEFNDMCDSIAVRKVGTLTLPLLANPRYVQGFRLVSEAEVGQAMRRLSQACGKLVEPAGALSYAVACKRAEQLWRQAKPGDVPTVFVAPVCGANVTKRTYDYFKRKAMGD